MRHIFITGNSSGIGQGLAKLWSEQGEHVYGLSRRNTGDGAKHVQADVSDFQALPAKLNELLGGVECLDLVVLNAGVLGEIKDMQKTTLEEIQSVMTVNVWSNKVLCDWLLANIPQIKQVVMISSGAAVNGNRGWGPYSLSKASLNMLTKLYAAESDKAHWSALAPGLVDTAMQDYLCGSLDPEEFPSVSKLRDARGTSRMPKPQDAAKMLNQAMTKILELPSGSFADVRQMEL